MTQLFALFGTPLFLVNQVQYLGLVHLDHSAVFTVVKHWIMLVQPVRVVAISSTAPKNVKECESFLLCKGKAFKLK